MAEVIISIFKKIIVVLVVVSVFLPLITTLFNFISTILGLVPTFASAYVRMGVAAFVFKFIKEMIADV